MKKIIYFGLIVSFIIAAGCGKSAKEKVLGTWKLKSIEGQNLTQDELKNANITFTSDGKVIAVAGKDKMEGTWDMAKDEKSLSIGFKESNEKDVWHIVTLTDNEFSYTQGDKKEKVTLGK